jgi:hypothetical protein
LEERVQNNAHRQEKRNEMDAKERERVNSQRRENDVLKRHQMSESRRMRGIESIFKARYKKTTDSQ